MSSSRDSSNKLKLSNEPSKRDPRTFLIDYVHNCAFGEGRLTNSNVSLGEFETVGGALKGAGC
jgi:hypothetical protein